MENNSMVSFSEIMKIFKDNNVYIPLIQRNYKWSADIASKLAEDLREAFKGNQETYTIGMITFYKEDEKKLQLIDGQQRIITLYMILKFLDQDNEYFTFEFERDEGILKEEEKRINNLKNIYLCSSWGKKITDVERFKKNYCAISDKMKDVDDDSEKKEFIEYIQKNLYFLLHISETEPFDEFMNLNNNKTRFVISDRIKANLMIDAKEDKDDILELFRGLSKSLFANSELWELVSQGYCEDVIPQDKSKRRKDKHYPDENRLKLLCCERYGSDNYDVSGTLGYEFEKEKDILTKYKDILDSLTNDMNNNNWNSYNGFNCLHIVSAKKKEQGLRFFQLLKGGEFKYLEEYFKRYLKDTKFLELSPFNQSCFIESQLHNSKSEINYIDMYKTIKESFDESKESDWFSSGYKYFDAFLEAYELYINNKYKMKAEENNNGIK